MLHSHYTTFRVVGSAAEFSHYTTYITHNYPGSLSEWLSHPDLWENNKNQPAAENRVVWTCISCNDATTRERKMLCEDLCVLYTTYSKPMDFLTLTSDWKQTHELTRCSKIAQCNLWCLDLPSYILRHTLVDSLVRFSCVLDHQCSIFQQVQAAVIPHV